MNTRRIIGIDPGLRNTGWGVIEHVGSRLIYIASGVIKPNDKQPLANRLAELFDELTKILETHQPREAAVEETFVNKSPRDTLKLGQARGIAMLAPARLGLSVAEYAPNTVKKAVVGVGHAEKQQIRAMIEVLLPKANISKDDEADALAIAICHAHSKII